VEVEGAILELVSKGKPDKYRQRPIPDKFAHLVAIGRKENIQRLLSGKPPEGVDDALAAKAAKFVAYKAPLALKVAAEIIDQQIGKPMEAAVEIELARLSDIFSTADALEGLSSLGRKRPEFKGA
jgi:enoyl-CoA hydratase/3-hydroxyacyl-CoA dehydrogenase